MSLSECSSAQEVEFAYQTRLVVYKFLGLVPTQGLGHNDSGPTEENNGNLGRDIPLELSSLPQVSLIDKLKDSEEHFAKNRSVCDELRRKVKRISSDSPKSESQRSSRISNSSFPKFYTENLHKSLLQEIKLKSKLKTSALDNLQPMTVIQKQTKFKVFIEPQFAAHQGFDITPISDEEFRPPTNFMLSSPMVQKDGRSPELLDSSDSDNVPLNDNSQTSVASNSSRSFGRQASGMSTSSRKLRTYVDVSEVDDETLKSVRTLPNSAISLKREISEVVNQLESDYNYQINSFRQRSEEASPVGISRPSPDPGGSASGTPSLDESAVCQVADRLRVLSDRLYGEYVERSESIIDELVAHYYAEEEYFQERFQEFMRSFLEDATVGWGRVALLLSVGQRLVLRLFESGSSGVSDLGELMARMLEEFMGDFIHSNGGWSAVNELALIEQQLDLDSGEILNSYVDDSRDSRDLETVREDDRPGGPTLGSKLKPFFYSVSDAVAKSGSAESASDAGVQNNSQDFVSTPTEERHSQETGIESTDEGFPENSNGFNDDAMTEPKKKVEESSSPRRGSFQEVPRDAENDSEATRETSENSFFSAFAFVSEYAGRTSARKVLMLSIFIGGSVLLWKFALKKKGG